MINGKLQVVIVGGGDMGNRHAHSWQSLPHAQVRAVVDTNEDRARALAQKVGASDWFAHFLPAIQMPEVDVVSVCIPTCAHAEVSIAAANLGKHVFCEKPIALSLVEADAMISAARHNSIKLGIGFVLRYSPVMNGVQKCLQEGTLGHPVLYTCVDARELRPKRIMHDHETTGGSIIDMGVHIYNEWEYIFGTAPVSVQAQGLKLAQHRPELADLREIAYDTASVNVKYASGDIGTFIVTWGLPPGVEPQSQPDRIYGPCGLGEVIYELDRQEFRVLREGTGWEVIASSTIDMHQEEIEQYAKCILEDTTPFTTGEQGKAALRVAIAAIEAIESGKTVFL